MEDGYLRCKCKKSCGSIVDAEVLAHTCDFFGNDNGRLFCDINRNNEYEDDEDDEDTEARTASGETQDEVLDPNLPGGSYLDSCERCRVLKEDQDYLHCLCQKPSGERAPTMRALSTCERFANDNGQLVCDGPGVGQQQGGHQGDEL